MEGRVSVVIDVKRMEVVGVDVGCGVDMYIGMDGEEDMWRFVCCKL